MKDLSPARVLVGVIRVYQFFSRFWPRQCRFHPSCSHYAAEALGTHGLARGCWLALKRLGRCHPWHPGGLDPVPPAPRGPARDVAASTGLATSPAGPHLPHSTEHPPRSTSYS